MLKLNCFSCITETQWVKHQHPSHVISHGTTINNFPNATSVADTIDFAESAASANHTQEHCQSGDLMAENYHSNPKGQQSLTTFNPYTETHSAIVTKGSEYANLLFAKPLQFTKNYFNSTGADFNNSMNHSRGANINKLDKEDRLPRYTRSIDRRELTRRHQGIDHTMNNHSPLSYPDVDEGNMLEMYAMRRASEQQNRIYNTPRNCEGTLSRSYLAATRSKYGGDQSHQMGVTSYSMSPKLDGGRTATSTVYRNNRTREDLWLV